MDALQPGETGFLDLPVEARLRVYKHYFKTKNQPSESEYVKIDLHSGRWLVKQHLWPLFQVCKKIYYEIMPEYYSTTAFHFNSLVHLLQTISSQAIFQNYARHIVLNPHFSLPNPEQLLTLPNLRTFAVSNIMCNEPIGTPKGAALEWKTLKTAIDVENSISPGLLPVKSALELHQAMVQSLELRERNVHLLLRFRYSYVEKEIHPDGWGGKTAKRHRLIDYDCEDDAFVLLQPDEGEKGLITRPDY